jgi:hypothetical protein
MENEPYEGNDGGELSPFTPNVTARMPFSYSTGSTDLQEGQIRSWEIFQHMEGEYLNEVRTVSCQARRADSL